MNQIKSTLYELSLHDGVHVLSQLSNKHVPLGYAKNLSNIVTQI